MKGLVALLAMAAAVQAGVAPSAPQFVTISSVTRTTATVSWFAPIKLGASVSEYRTQVATYPNDAVVGNFLFTNADFQGKCRGPDRFCILENLESNRTYRIRVRAGADTSFGPYSQPFDFTFPTVPPPPTSPTSIKASSDSLLLTWEPPLWPDLAQPRANISRLSPSVLSPVLGYEIETSSGPASPFELKFRVESNATQQLLQGLQPGQLYRFRIRAWNVIGYSSYSDVAAAFTQTNLPDVPANLTFVDVTETAARAQWIAPPENGGRVTRYDLVMVERNGVTLQHAVLAYSGGGGDTSALVKDLHPGWVYGFRVRAANGNGNGQFGPIAQVRLRDPVPEQPPPPTVVERGPEELHVTFQPGPANGAVVTRYEMAYNQEFPDSRPSPFQTAYSGARPEYWLRHLQIGGCYRLRVRTVTDSATASVWSHDARACVQPLVPRAPLAPHALNITDHSLTVRWSVPSDRGAAVLGFHLEMMGPAAVPSPDPSAPHLQQPPLSVAARYTRVYSGPGTEVTLAPLLPATAYSLRVVAESEAGDSDASPVTTASTLPLLPDPPQPVQATATSASSIAVAFAPRETKGTLQTLPVDAMQLQAAEGPAFSRAIALWHDVYAGGDRSFTLVGLKPNAKYRFRVRARNARGWGEWSLPSTFSTSAAAPDTITTVRIVEKDPVHVLFAWDAPNDNGSPLRGYVVDLARGTGRLQRYSGASVPPEFGPWKTVQNGPRQYISLMDGLHISVGEIVQLRVKAVNSAGDGAWSTPYVFWTRPGEDGLPFMPDQVQRPNVTHVTATAATVSWHRPDGNGAPIVRFDVEIAPVSDGVCDPNPGFGRASAPDCATLQLQPAAGQTGQFLSGCFTQSDPKAKTPAGLTCQLGNLEAGAKYIVRVVAQNFVGKSSPSPAALLALFSAGHGMPPTPLQPHVVFADTASVLIRWHAEYEHDSVADGNEERVVAFDVGMSPVPSSLVRRLVSIDSALRAARRSAFAGLAQGNGEVAGGALPTNGTGVGRLSRTYGKDAEMDDVLTRGFTAQLDREMQGLLRDLPSIHVARVDKADEMTYRAEELTAGQAYALKIRAVEGDRSGQWSNAAFVALSPDVPLVPPDPVLVEAFQNNLTISVVPGADQGSPVLATTVEMVIMTGSGGKFSEPKPIATFVGRLDGAATFLLTVDELPSGSPYGFRVGSTNAVGQGTFSPLVYFRTADAPVARPDAPLVVSVTAHEVAVKFHVADIPRRPSRHSYIQESANIPTEMVGGNPNHVLVSGTDFLFGTHQAMATNETSGSAQLVKFHMVANIADDRSFKTVCNLTGPSCTVEGLRANTAFSMKVRAIAPWATSEWSDAVTVTTDQSYPDPPSEPQLLVVHDGGKVNVTVSWMPPDGNGLLISGFEVLAGAVVGPERAALENVVASDVPPNRFTVSPTAGMARYFPAKGDGQLLDATLAHVVVANRNQTVLVPNSASPEAVRMAKRQLPLPRNLMPPVVSELKEEDAFTKYQRVVASDVRTLSYSWELDAPANDTLFVVRVRAKNAKGVGPLSPIKRFHAAAGRAALPPNQPDPPMVARSNVSSILVEWSAPATNGAAVSWYMLRILDGPLTDATCQSFQDVYAGPATQYLVPNLVPDSTYYLYLYALNAAGMSPPSNVLRAQTAADHP